MTTNNVLNKWGELKPLMETIEDDVQKNGSRHTGSQGTENAQKHSFRTS